MLQSGKQLPEAGIKKEEEEAIKDVKGEEKQTEKVKKKKEDKKEVPKTITPPLAFPQRQQRANMTSNLGIF